LLLFKFQSIIGDIIAQVFIAQELISDEIFSSQLFQYEKLTFVLISFSKFSSLLDISSDSEIY